MAGPDWSPSQTRVALQALKPGGSWVLGDSNAFDSHAENMHSFPPAPLVYGFSWWESCAPTVAVCRFCLNCVSFAGKNVVDDAWGRHQLEVRLGCETGAWRRGAQAEDVWSALAGARLLASGLKEPVGPSATLLQPSVPAQRSV